MNTTQHPPNETELKATQAPPALLSFLRRVMATHPVERFEVRHCLATGGTAIIGEVRHEATLDDPELSLETLGCDLTLMIENDCEALPGMQLYVVSAYKPGMTRPCMRQNLRFRGGDEEEDMFGPTEAANLPGLLAQSQRHSEVLMRIGVDAMMALKRENTRELERLTRRAEHLEDQRDNIFTTMAELANAKTEREIKLVQAKREDRQHELMFSTLNMMVPALAAKLLPGGVGNAPRGGDLLRDFILDISPLQMQKIMQILNPAQIASVQALHAAYQKGEVPSFGDEIVARFLDSLGPSQAEAFDKILRPDQTEKLQEIAKQYFEARQIQGGAEPATPQEQAAE